LETCSLYYGNREYGKVSWYRKETTVYVEARCSCELGMIYRVILQTKNALVPLGVMLPEGEDFITRKEISGTAEPICAYIDRMRPGEKHLDGLPVALSSFVDLGQGVLSAWWIDVQYQLFPLEIGKSCVGAQFLSIATPIVHDGICYGLFCKRMETAVWGLFLVLRLAVSFVCAVGYLFCSK